MDFDKSNLKCFTFHKTKHFKKDYFERGKKEDFIKIIVFLDEYGYENVGT